MPLMLIAITKYASDIKGRRT